MRASIRTAAALCAGLALAGAAAAQDPVERRPGGAAPKPLSVSPSDAMAKPAMGPEAAALHAKLTKARAELAALASQPPPPGLAAADAAALRAAQEQDRRTAQVLALLAAELEGGTPAADVGQKLQFQLQEANITYQQSQQAQSSALKRHHEASKSIISNLR